MRRSGRAMREEGRAARLRATSAFARPVPRSPQGGFTLVEMIAAFVIFALGFGILLEVLGDAVRTTRQAQQATQAALYAQSLLDTQGVGEPLKEGGSSGDFDDTYHWQLNVVRFQPQQPAAGSTLAPSMAAPGQPELFQLELIVSWGNQYLQHHARFVTLRSMMPPQPGLGGAAGRSPGSG